MITIFEHMREKAPISAMFCDMINDALKGKPDMSLAEFAAVLDRSNKQEAYERVVAAERKQFGMEEAK